MDKMTIYVRLLSLLLGIWNLADTDEEYVPSKTFSGCGWIAKDTDIDHGIYVLLWIAKNINTLGRRSSGYRAILRYIYVSGWSIYALVKNL